MNGMIWCLWPVLPIILYPMNIQRNQLSSLCLEETPVLPLNTLLEPKVRYMGNDINTISLETMKNLYEIAATNLKLAQEKGDPQGQPPPTTLQPIVMVLIQDHNKGPYDPKYIGDYRVISLKGNQVENTTCSWRTNRDETYQTCQICLTCR